MHGPLPRVGATNPGNAKASSSSGVVEEELLNRLPAGISRRCFEPAFIITTTQDLIAAWNSAFQMRQTTVTWIFLAWVRSSVGIVSAV